MINKFCIGEFNGSRHVALFLAYLLSILFHTIMHIRLSYGKRLSVEHTGFTPVLLVVGIGLKAKFACLGLGNVRL